MIGPQFSRVAAAVTERTAELLGAQTSVIDARGIVVASSDLSIVGLPFERGAWREENDFLRVPLRLDGQTGTIVVSEPPAGEAISPRLAEVLVELMVHRTVAVDRRPNQPELKNRFINDLLNGRITDEATILQEGKLLGMDFTPPRAVILIDAAEYILPSDNSQRREASDTQIRRRAQLVIGSVVSFFHLPNDTICAYLGDGEVAVLKASNTKNLVTWADHNDASQATPSWANLSALRRAGEALLVRLRSDTDASISLGIGRYHPGVCGLARSYQDARAALSLGRHFHGQNRVHGLDGLGIAAFVGLSDERTKIDLATYLLSPLDHEPELLETLNVFFAEDCCPSSVASRLAIHRNTLGYRLDKITSLTGLDPRRFDAAVQIRLALLLRSLSGKSA
ncbi:MAG TPA: helix-turn-helix domain-containing protein [Herpetosiphonaceae bacterium]|nr:helix-turn-helix domain-containing protein [Herpetosiphonaceae bacterium]